MHGERVFNIAWGCQPHWMGHEQHPNLKQGKFEGFDSCDRPSNLTQPLVNSNWSYSLETPNLGQIRRFLEPCDLEIWQMTLKNNRAPLLSNIKLYASFHHHMWIQTWVTVRKRLSWVVTSVTLTFVLWPWPFAWTLLWSLVITSENATHLLRLLDMMYKYEMDLASIVEDTERTWFCPQMDAQTDGQTHDMKPVVPPFNFVEVGGIMTWNAPSWP